VRKFWKEKSVPVGNEGLDCWLILKWILNGFGFRFWFVYYSSEEGKKTYLYFRSKTNQMHQFLIFIYFELTL
jgi:hypothetical protein